MFEIVTHLLYVFLHKQIPVFPCGSDPILSSMWSIY